MLGYKKERHSVGECLSIVTMFVMSYSLVTLTTSLMNVMAPRPMSMVTVTVFSFSSWCTTCTLSSLMKVVLSFVFTVIIAYSVLLTCQ